MANRKPIRSIQLTSHEVAAGVRTALGRRAPELPLAAILQGGTWTAGRAVARALRSDGAPPLAIDGDGTLF